MAAGMPLRDARPSCLRSLNLVEGPSQDDAAADEGHGVVEDKGERVDYLAQRCEAQILSSRCAQRRSSQG